VSDPSWVRLERNDDWCHIYFGPLRPNWYDKTGKSGTAVHALGLKVKAGEVVRCRMKDGAEIDCVVSSKRELRAYGDMGHDYSFVGELPVLFHELHGQVYVIQINDVELEASFVKEHVSEESARIMGLA